MSNEPFKIVLNSENEYQSLLQGRPQTRGMRSGRVYLEKGQECGLHSTKAHEEILVFLKGKGSALTGPEQNAIEVGESMVLYIPPHTEHNIKNDSGEPLVYIYCVAPVNDSDND